MTKKTIKLIRALLSLFFKLAGIILGFYIGVWMMGIHNLYDIVRDFFAGELAITSFSFLKQVIALLLSLTVAGAIWIVGDVLSTKFKNKKNDEEK